MKKIIIIICSFTFYLFAQNITSVEYYIDTDPGFGNGNNITITPGQDITANFIVDLSSIDDGFHVFYVRGIDANGKWSIAYSRPFYKQALPDVLQNITSVEYFIDTDPGFGNGNSITITPGLDITADFIIDLSSYDDGFHIIYVRGMDANGKWSIAYSRPFYKEIQKEPLANITEVKYYFSNADTITPVYSYSNFTPAPDVDVSFDADISALALNTNYYLHIYGKDDNSKRSIEYTYEFATGTAFLLTVSVDDGWNMVSIPGLHPTNQNVTTWWSGLTGSVFKFSGGYQVVTTATPGEGYWMKHTGANVYNTGDEWPAGGIEIVPHDTISAAAGWNIIGGYEDRALTSGLTTYPSGLISGSVFGYSGGYNPVDTLVPGYGYWIKLNADGGIIIPPPGPGPLAKGSGEVEEYLKDDWGRITITDNAGRSYTLYAVKGEVDLSLYELPPIPPAGMFDIRFSSDRIAEDVSSSTQSIEMSGMKYPITVKVENMDIRLQDEMVRR